MVADLSLPQRREDDARPRIDQDFLMDDAVRVDAVRRNPARHFLRHFDAIPAFAFTDDFHSVAFLELAKALIVRAGPCADHDGMRVHTPFPQHPHATLPMHAHGENAQHGEHHHYPFPMRHHVPPVLASFHDHMQCMSIYFFWSPMLSFPIQQYVHRHSRVSSVLPDSFATARTASSKSSSFWYFRESSFRSLQIHSTIFL